MSILEDKMFEDKQMADLSIVDIPVNPQEERRVKVRLRFVTKRYEMVQKRTDYLKSMFVKKKFPPFWAIRGVDFDAYEGETIAVIGTNGSGKSTLMKIIAGIIPPTTGVVEVHGETSLLAINAGLKGSMTGRENIRMKALMLGLTNAEIDERINDIIEFSELGKFIDQQVKTYSSGMRSKLGFAISVHTDPDILIIDEALSVGDATFTNKALQKIKEFQAAGKTIFFVSHGMGQVRDFADRVIWMHYGYMRAIGSPNYVLRKYSRYIQTFKKFNHEQQLAHQKKFKTEQAQFNLKTLYEIEVKRMERRTSQSLNRSERGQLRKLVYSETESNHSSILTKLFITLVVTFTVITGWKTMLNMTWASVIQNPAHLITNLSPKELHALNTRHGRNSNSSTKKASVVTGDVAVNTYQVQANDTIISIASQFHVSEADLKKANDLKSNYISQGQVLSIPASKETK